MKTSRIAKAVFVMSWLAVMPAQAIELKVADSFPVGHYLVRLILQPWMDEVTKRTNGGVTFIHYPNQQIGKAADMLRLTQAGVVDVAYIAPAYISDKLPLSEVATLPESFRSSCQGTRAYWKSAREGLLAKNEYEPNKIRLMLAVTLPPETQAREARGLPGDEASQLRRCPGSDAACAGCGAGADVGAGRL